MQDSSLDTLGVWLGLLIRRIRSYFQPKSPWEKVDTYPPPVVAPVAATAPENAPLQAVESAPSVDESERGLWVDCDYCWVVICKNNAFHHKGNPHNVHRIPLGATDAYSPSPVISQPFRARCNECLKEYTYHAWEVLRWEMGPPLSFEPHPLFRD